MSSNMNEQSPYIYGTFGVQLVIPTKLNIDAGLLSHLLLLMTIYFLW